MKQINLIKNKKNVIYVKKSFVWIKMMKNKKERLKEKKIKEKKERKNKRKVKDHCHSKGKSRGAAHSKCNLNYKITKDIPIIIHNTSYDTHFIINQLAEEFEGELNCVRENVEKYITFSVPIKKKT